MIFKHHDRMTEEWWGLNLYLWRVIVDVEIWCRERKINPVWTCFVRSEEEQDDLVEAGKAKKRNTVHYYGRGADLRLIGSKSQELVNYINAKFPYGKGSLKTALLEPDHIHFQVKA